MNEVPQGHVGHHGGHQEQGVVHQVVDEIIFLYVINHFSIVFDE